MAVTTTSTSTTTPAFAAVPAKPGPGAGTAATPGTSTAVAATTSKQTDESLQALIQAEREAADLLKAKQADLNEKIRERSGGREEYVKERDALRAQIGEITKKIGKMEDERREMSEHEQRFGGSSNFGANSGGVSTNDSSSMRWSRSRLENIQRSSAVLGAYRTTAAVDERLKEIEYCIMTTSMTLKDEKVLKMEADKLRKHRGELLEMEELEQRIQSTAAEQAAEQKTKQTEMVDRRNEIRDELRVLRDERDTLRVKLQVLETNRTNVLAPLKALYDHRDSLRSQIAEHMARINVWTEQLQMQEMEARAEQARKRQARAEIDRFDRQLKVIEQDKKSLRTAIANTVQPNYDAHVAKALQMQEYLQHEIDKYEKALARNDQARADAAKESGDSPAGASEPQKVQLDNQTYVVHRKKVDDNIVVPGKRRVKPGKPVVVSQYLNHSLASLNDLRSLDVSIPKTITEARETLAEIEAIVSRHREKLEATSSIQAKKQADLEKRLEVLLTKENELLAKAPHGWKPSPPASSAAANNSASGNL